MYYSIEPENPHNSSVVESINQYPMFTDFFTLTSANDCNSEFGKLGMKSAGNDPMYLHFSSDKRSKNC